MEYIFHKLGREEIENELTGRLEIIIDISLVHGSIRVHIDLSGVDISLERTSL